MVAWLDQSKFCSDLFNIQYMIGRNVMSDQWTFIYFFFINNNKERNDQTNDAEFIKKNYKNQQFKSLYELQIFTH